MGFSKTDLEKGYYLGEMLAKVGLLFAAAFAVYQFSKAQELRRVERTLTYIDHFERGDIAEARRRIDGLMRPYARQFAAVSRAGGISAQDKRDMVLVLIEDDANNALADDLDRQADFYDGLRLCVQERLCEDSVAEDYFCAGRARELWEDFRPYFDERRQNNPRFALGLEWCALLKKG